jgi:phage terminase large subunit-like protein
VVVQQDAAGNMKPSKLKSRQKIDGIVAGLMALARAMAHQEAGVSVYQSRGLRVL